MNIEPAPCASEIAVIRRIVAVVGDELPSLPYLHQVNEDPPRAMWIPGAALAHCRILLDASVVLLDHHRGNVVGALLRPLYEVWLTGLYALLGGPDAAERLLDARDFHLRPLDQDFFLRAPGRPGKRLSIKQMAAEVRTLLETTALTAVRYDPLFLYRTVYAFDSYSVVHGGLGAFETHLGPALPENLDGTVPVVIEPKESGIGCSRLTLAALLVIEFAEEMWASSGLNSGHLACLEQDLRAANRAHSYDAR